MQIIVQYVIVVPEKKKMPRQESKQLTTEMLFNVLLFFNYIAEKRVDHDMDQKYYDMIECNPVIAAVKDMNGLERCCTLEDIRVVFILFGDICNIRGIVRKVKEGNKMAVVHIDLINGLGSKEVAVDFIRDSTMADGIITTKPALIKRGKERGLFTVLRFFLIDSMALENICNLQYSVQPDIIEVLPGLMPDIIKKVCQISRVSVIAGGLITEKRSVLEALSAGAISVSSTNQNVWMM